MRVHIRGGRNAKVWLRVLFYIFDELSNIQKEDAILLWLIYVYNSEIQTLWFAAKTSIEVHYGWF